MFIFGNKNDKNKKTALFGNRRNQRFLGSKKAEAFCGETWERK